MGGRRARADAISSADRIPAADGVPCFVGHTVCQCQLIVSWNFKHIVNFQKIPQYNGVNMLHGYGPLAIHSPEELTVDDDQGV